MSSITSIRSPGQAKTDFVAAVDLLFDEPYRFVTAYRQNPAQAIVSLVRDRTAYGKLNTICGELTVKRNLAAVLRLARALYVLDCQQANRKPEPTLFRKDRPGRLVQWGKTVVTGTG